MSFYHIMVVTSQNMHIYKYDLLKDETVNDYLKPYLNKEYFFIDGFHFVFDEIEQFKIVETYNNIDTTMNEIRVNFRASGIVGSPSEWDIFDSRNYSKDVTNDLIKELGQESKVKVNPPSSKKVFVVHGHDTNLLSKVENFIRSIGLEPIVLFKEADKGKTVIEKIEEYSENACYSIIIYTKCDVGYSKGNESNARPRARQNVIFEHGYMMALLGRSNVCALLESDEIETPSDINGILYVPYDNYGSWMYSIAKNMRASNIEVDLNML